MAMAGLLCTGFGLFFLVVGLFIAIGGPFLIPAGITYEIDDFLVVDSTNSPQYADWAGGYDIKMEYQMVFYMWNLTNMEFVANHTEKPNYESVGPYIFRRYRTAIDVQFLNDGNQVQYANFKDYVFDRANSVGDDTDMFTNLNPVYADVLSQAKEEAGLFTVLSTPFVVQAIDYLTGPFIQLFSVYVSPSFLTVSMNNTINLLTPTYGDNARSFFLNAWANATTAPSEGGNWAGLLVSSGGNVSSGISVTSANLLFDPTVSQSLFSVDPDVAWAWAHASDSTNSATLMNAFNITQPQLQMIVNWRENIFAKAVIYPYYITTYSLTNITDLGWVQYFDGSPLEANSVCTLWDELACAGYELFQVSTIAINPFPTWQFTKVVLDPTTGLLNTYNFQAMATAYSAQQQNYSKWGLTSKDQADYFVGYSFSMGYGYALPYMIDLYGPTAGLFRTKSVVDWIFNCTDFLITALQPDAPPCSILVNHTAYPPTTINTGKDDITKINTYIKWRDMEYINDVWNGSLQVTGHTELGQFQPHLGQEDLQVFDNNLVRPLTLVYNSTTEVVGITAQRYIMDWRSAFGLSDFYYQTIFGAANMATFENGAPIYITLWDLMGVEGRLDMVDGLVTNYTSEVQYNAVIDVEPVTGTTVQSRKRVQVNVYLANADPTPFDKIFTNNNPPLDIFYPLMRAGEYVTISNDLASMLQDKLTLLPEAKRDLFWVFVTVGPALALLGSVMVIIGLRRRKAALQYDIIN